ncbi:Xylose isomerase domain-containing protein TIM barrel [Planctomycetales bacterium 10988]|nr:Xylose isomerase domain-containing protein TIM barrel [Planctomycetales bacterium 10988]
MGTALNRRQILTGTAAALASLGYGVYSQGQETAEKQRGKEGSAVREGRIRHSVVPWCFKPMPVEQLAHHAKALGIESVELIDPKYFPLLQELGLTCAIGSSGLGFRFGLANPAYEEKCLKALRENIEHCSAFGVKRIITFSGMSEGIPQDVGLENMVKAVKKIIGLAEKKDVAICVEMLNTRVSETMKGHPGYMADSIEWCVELCQRVDSPHMKILFDIYHVQIMQGDIIKRIREFHPYIGHYHTAGNPGRNELDDQQEINYPAIMKAIVESNYDGFVGHEFIPREENAVESLRQAVKVCTV